MSDFLKKITNSLLAILTLLSPHRNSPRNQPITKITIHHTAGNITLRALLDFMQRATTRASYNYGICSNGGIGLIVEERDRCWATSSAWNDNRAVVIGVANIKGAPNWEVSDAAFNALIDLCVDICKRNPGITQKDGKPGLYFDGTQEGSLTHHRMFSNTSCPGQYLLDRFPLICELVNAQLNSVQTDDTPAEIVPAEATQTGVEEIDMNANNEIRFNTIQDIPEWARKCIERLMDAGILTGTGTCEKTGERILNISEDMKRTLILTLRMIDNQDAL